MPGWLLKMRGNVFQVFGLNKNMHDIVENAFVWAGNSNWVLEIVPDLSR